MLTVINFVIGIFWYALFTILPAAALPANKLAGKEEYVI